MLTISIPNPSQIHTEIDKIINQTITRKFTQNLPTNLPQNRRIKIISKSFGIWRNKAERQVNNYLGLIEDLNDQEYSEHLYYLGNAIENHCLPEFIKILEEEYFSLKDIDMCLKCLEIDHMELSRDLKCCKKTMINLEREIKHWLCNVSRVLDMRDQLKGYLSGIDNNLSYATRTTIVRKAWEEGLREQQKKVGGSTTELEKKLLGNMQYIAKEGLKAGSKFFQGTMILSGGVTYIFGQMHTWDFYGKTLPWIIIVIICSGIAAYFTIYIINPLLRIFDANMKTKDLTSYFHAQNTHFNCRVKEIVFDILRFIRGKVGERELRKHLEHLGVSPEKVKQRKVMRKFIGTYILEEIYDKEEKEKSAVPCKRIPYMASLVLLGIILFGGMVSAIINERLWVLIAFLIASILLALAIFLGIYIIYYIYIDYNRSLRNIGMFLEHKTELTVIQPLVVAFMVLLGIAIVALSGYIIYCFGNVDAEMWVWLLQLICGFIIADQTILNLIQIISYL